MTTIHVEKWDNLPLHLPGGTSSLRLPIGSGGSSGEVWQQWYGSGTTQARTSLIQGLPCLFYTSTGSIHKGKSIPPP